MINFCNNLHFTGNEIVIWVTTYIHIYLYLSISVSLYTYVSANINGKEQWPQTGKTEKRWFFGIIISKFTMKKHSSALGKSITNLKGRLSL